jgi:hypothetical protein
VSLGYKPHSKADVRNFYQRLAKNPNLYMKQQGQKLDTDNLQDVLDAGSNAARVGRQQFFTPLAIAQALMLMLPKKQSSFVDLTMGDGAILRASAAPELFGIDIDSRLARKPSIRANASPEQDGGSRRTYLSAASGTASTPI